jgi:hypothetical protein
VSTDNEFWGADFNALRADIDSSVKILFQLITMVREHSGGHLDPDLESLFTRLVELLDHSRGTTQTLCERLVWRPVQRFLRSLELTREEYYMTVAAGMHSYTAKAAGLSAFDDFEIFTFFCYEDEERRCYINPSMQPLPPGRIRLHGGGLGEPPENLSWSKLRPEQQAFFTEYLPSIAERFERSV